MDGLGRKKKGSSRGQRILRSARCSNDSHFRYTQEDGCHKLNAGARDGRPGQKGTKNKKNSLRIEHGREGGGRSASWSGDNRLNKSPKMTRLSRSRDDPRTRRISGINFEPGNWGLLGMVLPRPMVLANSFWGQPILKGS